MKCQQITLVSVILLLAIGKSDGQVILRETIQSAGKAINEIANVSFSAVKSVVNAVDHSIDRGLDIAIETRDFIADRVKKAIEQFRIIMLQGSTELGIPQLEPFKVDHVDFDIHHAIGNFNGTLDKLNIKDLSLFVLNDVTWKNVGSKLHINVSFPTIRVTEGLYDIDGIIGDLFKLYGKGPFTLTFFDFDTIVDCSLGRQNQEFYLKSLDVQVKLGRSECNFKDIEGGGKLEEIFNKMLSDILPEALDLLWPEIEPPLTENIKPMLNELLKKINLFPHIIGDLEKIFPHLG